MSKESFYTLRIFKSVKHGTDGLSEEEYRKQTDEKWNNIFSKVNSFNKAETIGDKMKSLYPELYQKKKEDKNDSKK